MMKKLNDNMLLNILKRQDCYNKICIAVHKKIKTVLSIYYLTNKNYITNYEKAYEQSKKKHPKLQHDKYWNLFNNYKLHPPRDNSEYLLNFWFKRYGQRA